MSQTRKNGTPLFWVEVAFEWYESAMISHVFIFSFLFKNSGKREQVDENNFRHCYGKFFFESAIPKVLDHSYYNPPWQQHLKDTLQLRILWTWSTWTLRTWSLYQDIWLCVCSSFSQTSLVFKFNLLLIK